MKSKWGLLLWMHILTTLGKVGCDADEHQLIKDTHDGTQNKGRHPEIPGPLEHARKLEENDDTRQNRPCAVACEREVGARSEWVGEWGVFGTKCI